MNLPVRRGTEGRWTLAENGISDGYVRQEKARTSSACIAG